MRLRGDCRPIRENGPRGWRRVGSERLAFLGSQPGSEVSAENALAGVRLSPGTGALRQLRFRRRPEPVLNYRLDSR
jgi:hypothetical protein